MKLNKRYRQKSFVRMSYTEKDNWLIFHLAEGETFKISRDSHESYCRTKLNNVSICGRYQTLAKKLNEEAFEYLTSYILDHEMFCTPEFADVTSISKHFAIAGALQVEIGDKVYVFQNQGKSEGKFLIEDDSSLHTCISGNGVEYALTKKKPSNSAPVELLLLYQLFFG